MTSIEVMFVEPDNQPEKWRGYEGRIFDAEKVWEALRYFSFVPGKKAEFSFVAESTAAYQPVLTADQIILKKTELKIDHILSADPPLPRNETGLENIQSPVLKRLVLAVRPDERTGLDDTGL